MTRPTWTMTPDPPDPERPSFDFWAKQQVKALRDGIGEKLFAALEVMENED